MDAYTSQFQYITQNWVLAYIEEAPGYETFEAWFRPLLGTMRRFLVVTFRGGYPSDYAIVIPE